MRAVESLFCRPGTVEWDAALRWWVLWSARVVRDLSPEGPRRRDAAARAAFLKARWWIQEQMQ